MAPTAELARVLDEIATWGPDLIDRVYHVSEGAISGVTKGRNRIGVSPDLLRDLWRAEATEQGRWLFIRFRTAGGRVEIERAYDHWPQWYPVEDSDGQWNRRHLVDELAARAPRWHPDWASVAVDDYAYLPG